MSTIRIIKGEFRKRNGWSIKEARRSRRKVIQLAFDIMNNGGIRTIAYIGTRDLLEPLYLTKGFVEWYVRNNYTKPNFLQNEK